MMYFENEFNEKA